MTGDRGEATALDVLVVGAGPTGLSLAAFLHRQGATVRIVDRAADRVHESRALAIQPRTLEVLAPLGVSGELVRRGNPAVRLHIHTGRREIHVPLFDLGVADTPFPFLLFLSQAQTEAVLEDHLRDVGVHVERRTELLTLRSTEVGVVCGLRRPDGAVHEAAARYVVGCDGAHSTVRHLAGIEFRGAAYPQTFLLADVEADGLPGDAAHAYLAAAGPLFFFPLGTPATWRVVAMVPRDDVAVADPVGLETVQQVVDRYTGGAVRLRDPVWMTTFRLHNRAASRYRAGRVLLAGDAAHIHSPAGAQGMNTGIQDAANLGWKLALVARGRAPARLVGTYDVERRPVGRRVLAFTDRAFTVATSSTPLLRFARRGVVPLVLPLVLRSAAARAAGFRAVSELAISYRRSPLSARPLASGRPRPGDRVPDAPLWLDGRRTTLHRALAGPTFHLLLSGRTPEAGWTVDELSVLEAAGVAVHDMATVREPGVLHDRTGMAHRRLGLDARHPAHLLVRPDGYVAVRGRAELRPARAFVEEWLDRGAGV